MRARTSGKKASYTPFAAAAILIIGIILLLVFDKLPFAAKPEAQAVQAGPAAQENSPQTQREELQPVNSYTVDEAGQKAELYSGILTKVSETSITLESAGKSREFPISRDAPPRFVVGSPEDDPSKLIELTGPLGVGMKINQLNLFISPSGEKQVTGAFISPQTSP